MRYLEYLKIPYLHMGRDFAGADCFGLVRLFYQRELGIDLPDYTTPYDQEWWREGNLLQDLYQEYGFSKVATLQYGDLIMFKNSTTVPGHLGINLTDFQFMHMARSGVAITSTLQGLWARQIHSVYRHKEALCR